MAEVDFNAFLEPDIESVDIENDEIDFNSFLDVDFSQSTKSVAPPVINPLETQTIDPNPMSNVFNKTMNVWSKTIS